MLHKFKTAVHYICHEMNEDPTKLGSTKLNKILFYSDFLYFRENGVSITGGGYKKLQFGPVPKDIQAATSSLELEGAITLEKVAFFGKTMNVFKCHTKPDLKDFTENEIKYLDSITKAITENHTATSISDHSHDLIWEAATIGEDIPYFTSHLMNLAEIDEADIAWAQEEIEEYEG